MLLNVPVNSTLAGGYMEWSKAPLIEPWINNEVNIVIDGELHLSVDGETSVVEQGDMVYLPKGTQPLFTVLRDG
jgi:ethanolamine utilization protein EutQ